MMKGRIASMVGLVTLLTASAAGAAGDTKEAWDTLWHHVLIDLWVIGAVFGALAVVFLVKYRAKNADEVGSAPKLSKGQAIAWALVPAFLFMADDFFLAAKGWTLWNLQRTVPADAMEIKVEGSKWFWEFEYENGATSTYSVDDKEGDGLVVRQGTPVVLRMSATDVVHSFALPEYRIKEDLMPGRVTYLWFNPKELKESVVVCNEYCGNRHSFMYAPVRVLPPEEFDAWVKKKLEG